MFLYSSWLRLPLSTRAELARVFGVSKSSPTHVQDNVVVSDGYKVHDIEAALSVAAIQVYIGSGFTSKTTFDELWQMMVDRAEGRVPTIAPDAGTSAQVPSAWVVPEAVVEIPAQKPPKKSYYKSKTRAATKPKKNK